MRRDSEDDFVTLTDRHDDDDAWYDNGDGDDHTDEDSLRHLIEWARERKNILLAGGGVLLLLLFLVLVVFPVRGSSVSQDDFTALLLRVDRIESRVAQLDGLEREIVNLLETHKPFPDAELFAGRLDMLADRVQTLQQKMGTIVSDVQAARTAAEAPVRDSEARRYHTVIQGETLFSIARSYNISVERLCALNRMSPRDTLHVGRRLLISEGTP